MRRRRPADRMLSGVAKIFPRKFFSRFRPQLAPVSQLLLAHARLKHHFSIKIYIFTKIRSFYPRILQGMHGKKRSDTVCYDRHGFAAFKDGLKIRRKFLFRLPRRARFVIKPKHVATCKKPSVAGRFCRASVFSVYVYDYIFHDFAFLRRVSG